MEVLSVLSFLQTTGLILDIRSAIYIWKCEFVQSSKKKKEVKNIWKKRKELEKQNT